MRKTFLGFLTATALLGMVGCSNLGGSPSGASSADMKSTFDKLPLDERAKMLIDAPGPMDDAKKAHVRELYTKDGKTVPASIEKLLGGSGTGH